MYCEAQLGTVGEPFYENLEAESPCAEAVRHEWDISNAGRYNYLCTGDLYSPMHNVLDACIYIKWVSGRGFGPGIPEFFGPCEMGTSR